MGMAQPKKTQSHPFRTRDTAALGVGELLESHGFFKATSLAVFMVGCVWG